MQAVTVIPPLKKISSREKRHQFKRSSSRTFPSKSFTKVLEDACEKEMQKDVRICINGYTKDALPLNQLINLREYR